MSRQQMIAEAFVGVADGFGEGFDPLVVADRLLAACTALAGAEVAGLAMVNARGRLRTVAVSDDRVELLEVLQLQTGEGPCAECWQTGAQVEAPDIAREADRWPTFAAAAAGAGFSAAYGVPVRVAGRTVGALNLMGRRPLDADELFLAASLAQVAAGTMTLWRSEPTRPSDILSRIQAVVAGKAMVETAVGMLAAAGSMSVHDAGRALRAYCRHTGRPPVETAHALVSRELAPHEVLAPAATDG